MNDDGSLSKTDVLDPLKKAGGFVKADGVFIRSGEFIRRAKGVPCEAREASERRLKIAFPNERTPQRMCPI